MVCFDQGPATGWDWRKNEVTDMVLELLYHCIKIAVHQEQMGLGTANRLSRLKHSNYWVGCTRAKIEEKVRFVFLGVLHPLNVHRPITTPSKRGNEPFPGSTVA